VYDTNLIIFAWYAHDHLYSPAALINSLSNVIERYEYDAYGRCCILDPNFTIDADGLSDYDNPYLFTGRRWDILNNGSLKIQYSRNRYYDYHTGRFLTNDPLGITPRPVKTYRCDIAGQYKDGLNLYEYIGSNPVNFVDLFGLSKSAQACIRPLNIPPFKNSWLMVHCFIKTGDCGNWNYNNKGIGTEPKPGGVGRQTSKCASVKCECDICCMIEKSTWSGSDYGFFTRNCCHWVDSILKKSKCDKGIEELFPGYSLPTHPSY